MKTRFLCRWFQPILLASLLASASAQIPAQLNYQGRVTVGGVNFTGTGQFKFALVDGGTTFGERATASAVVSGGSVTAVNVVNSGTNYASPPAVTFSGPGTGATATAHLNLGIVAFITVTNGGSGYTTPPTVTLAPPSTTLIYSTLWSNDGTGSIGQEPTAFVTLSVNNGLYSVALADPALGMVPFYEPIFNQPLFLRVWFNDGTHGFQRLTPDQPLASAPYALRAKTVPDGAITAAKIAPGAVGPAQLSEPLARRGPAIRYLICIAGAYPSSGNPVSLGNSPVMGEIRMVAHDVAPDGNTWLPCDGRLLAIGEFNALFNVIGTLYGGDGEQTFALPDLRSAAPIGVP
jgi:microcystin-dependent protein